MKLSIPSEQVLRLGLFCLLVLLVAPVPGGSQQPVVRKVPVVPPRQVPPKPTPPPPVRPAARQATARVQPQVQQRPTPPPRQIQRGGVDPLAGRIAGGPGAPPAATQVNQVRGNNQRTIGGMRQPGTLASGGTQPGGFTAPPNARRVPMRDGGALVAHPDGRRWLVDKDNRVTAFSRPGMQAKFYGNGRLSSMQVVRPNGGGVMAIRRGLHGERETLGMRPGGVRVVTYGRDRGYVERPYPGRAGYMQRTYVVEGRPYVHVYRAYRYRGMVYYRYVPAYHYQPRFYGWVSNPWRSQVAYNWGWQSAPWYGFYGGYFTPAPAYPSASLWLTDFVVGENLKLAYQSRQESEPPPSGAPPSTEASSETTPVNPEVKDALSQEIHQQVADEESASGQSGGQPMTAANQPPPALDPNIRTFVVSENLDVTQSGQPCTLTPGDVINRTGDNVLAGGKVGVNVVSSKAGDCLANTPTEVELATLQEMFNQFREQVDAGLSTLAKSQGQAGLPSGPPANPRQDPEGVGQPDRDVVATLEDQRKDADNAEGVATDSVNGTATLQPAPGSAPVGHLAAHPALRTKREERFGGVKTT